MTLCVREMRLQEIISEFSTDPVLFLLIPDKELYRCYKCANIDYAKNYTDVSYRVDFLTNENDERKLDCSVNSKQDAENICECDKRFAANIAATQKSCEVEK